MAKMLENVNNAIISTNPVHCTLKKSGMKVVTKQNSLISSQNIGEGG
jgi:hypothetical protein